MSTLTEPAGVDLDTHYPLSREQITSFHEMGFIKLAGVLSPETIERYAPTLTRLTLDQNPRKGQVLGEKDTYGKAFIQVGNLWLKSHAAKEFVFSRRLARIAAELLGVRGIRLWHDQALYKEAGGGITPWHADQFYWPLATDRSITAWVPLQRTPPEMGPVAFAARSQHFTTGRDLAISDESEKAMAAQLESGGYGVVRQPFELGDVSFHLGWTYHRAEPNTTPTPRKVMTMIYMDQDMRLAKPRNFNQESDRLSFAPDAAEGEVIDSPLTPVLWSRDT